MIISEDTLEKTIATCRTISPEKRGIILYVGVHPNEKTHELVLPYHKEWEKYGVLVVQHPTELTPHAYWKNKKEKD